ncbi:MAG: hypothetical protein IPP90_16390 [Gemmatimonadaceae bacterium]|nr:hypothetical protein [Gemmatimonadaceae bacterium]
MPHSANAHTRDEGWRLTRLRLSHVWAMAAIALPLLITIGARMGSVDLTYHLRAGAMMLDSGALLRTDTFTFTAAGAPWVDQQWLGQVVLAWVFRAEGWLALALMRALLAGIVLVSVHAACRARGAAARPAAWLTLGSACLLLPTLQLRPQLFGLACFALTLWLIAGRRNHRRRLWFMVPLVMLWANLHGTFVLAIGLIGLAWLDDIHDRDRGASRLVIVGLASIAATLVNPFGARVWLYVLELSGNPAVRQLVAEWQPTSIDSFSGAVFLVSDPVVALLLARFRVRPAWPMLLALASFFLIGLLSVRGVYWWAMSVPVMLAGTSVGRAMAQREDPVNAGNSLIVVILVVALFASFGRWFPFRSADRLPTTLLTEAPMGITHALRGTLAAGERVFNAQAWGSWFEYALPDNPVAVDSRIELIPASVWTRYADVSNGRDGWQRILGDWNVRVVAVHPVQQAQLLGLISRDVGWTLAYRDADGAVFVRR